MALLPRCNQASRWRFSQGVARKEVNIRIELGKKIALILKVEPGQFRA